MNRPIQKISWEMKTEWMEGINGRDQRERERERCGNVASKRKNGHNRRMERIDGMDGTDGMDGKRKSKKLRCE